VMVLVNWVIISAIVNREQCIAAQVAVVFVTHVKNIGVKVQCITSKHSTHMHNSKY